MDKENMEEKLTAKKQTSKQTNLQVKKKKHANTLIQLTTQCVHTGAEVHNAAEASATAFNDASLMTPGMPGYAELVQLGLAHESHYDKESVLLNNIEKLGFTLNIQLRSFEVLHQQRQHTCVPIRGFAELMSQQCPERLLAGYKGESLSVFQQLLKRFWKCYQVYNASQAIQFSLKNLVHLTVAYQSRCTLTKAQVWEKRRFINIHGAQWSQRICRATIVISILVASSTSSTANITLATRLEMLF